LIVSKQKTISLQVWQLLLGGEKVKKICPRAQDTLATPLVRSAEECPTYRTRPRTRTRLGGVFERMV